MNVAILLPTYNEENGIGKVIEEINKIKDKSWEVVVVDGGSEDTTVEEAKKKGATVLDFKQRGKGRAIKYAFENLNHDYLILMDADFTYPPQAIPVILEKLKECDVVIGSRFKGNIQEGAMKGLNRLGNLGLTTLANILYSKKTSDVCSGMHGFTKKAYKSFNIDAVHFEVEANFFVEENKKNLRICEIPIDYKKREGKSKLSIKHGIKIAFYLLKKRF